MCKKSSKCLKNCISIENRIEIRKNKMNIESWIDHNLALRRRVVSPDGRYLLASFPGTKQATDIKQRTPLVGDYGRVKINVKALSAAERLKQGLPPLDPDNGAAINEAIKQEFDMPLWASHSGISVPVLDLNNTFVYQLKGCNLHCPWCYVDDSNRNGEREGGKFFSVSAILDIFVQEQRRRKKSEDPDGPVYNIRPSGGEMTLDGGWHWLRLLRLIQNRSVRAYVQGDTNLTTGSYMEALESMGLIKDHTLDKVGDFRNFGLLCSFKGTDTESFLSATGMPDSYAFLEEERWRTFAGFVRAGIDAYPFVYDPDPRTLKAFMEKGAQLFGENFILKTWASPLKPYGPEKARLQARGIDPEKYQRSLDEKFRQAEEVMQEVVHRTFRKNYKDVPRAGLVLKAAA